MNISCDDDLLPFCESTSTVAGVQGLLCYVYDQNIIISDSVNGDTTTKQYLFKSQSFFQFGTGVSLRRDGTRPGEITDEGFYALQLAAQLLTT